MGILQQSTLRVTMEAVRVLMTAALLGGAQCRPLQLTQEVLLTPFNFVRSTGNTALTTGQQVIQSVPEAVNAVSDTAVTGVNVVPDTISTVSDFTVDSINAVPETINTVTDFGVTNIRNAPANTIRFVNGVPGALVRTPGQVVNLGTGAFNTVGAVGSRVPAATGTAIQVGADAIRQTPQAFVDFGGRVVSSGTGFVRAVPGNLVRAPGTVISASSSGIRTVATDGVNMFTQIPANALQFTGTAFRTGEALVTGGTRLALATGDSLIRSGLNTLGGGGRILFATAGVPFNLAGSAAQRLRDMF